MMISMFCRIDPHTDMSVHYHVHIGKLVLDWGNIESLEVAGNSDLQKCSQPYWKKELLISMPGSKFLINLQTFAVLFRGELGPSLRCCLELESRN